MTSQRCIKPVMAGLLALALAACSILPEAESLTIYRLPNSLVADGDAAMADIPSLRINTPQASLALSGPRMLVNPQGDQLSTYKGARWSDPVPALVREHVAGAFAQRFSLSRISTDEHGLHADVHLGSDLQQFQVNYINGVPRATIELNARLINPGTRQVIAAKSFLVEQTLADVQVPGVVSAFQLAADDLASQLAEWVQSELQEG